MTIDLERAGVATGMVLGTDGRPLPQAALRVVSGGADVDQGGGGAFSDLEGKFRVVVPLRGTAEIVLTGFVIRHEVHAGEVPAFGGRLEGVLAGERGLVLRARPLAFDRALGIHSPEPHDAGAADERHRRADDREVHEAAAVDGHQESLHCRLNTNRTRPGAPSTSPTSSWPSPTR